MIHVTVGYFKRTAESEWELGIAIGPNAADIQVFVDRNFKLVPAPIYTFNLQQYMGAFTVHTL